ncbi:MAG TPA: sigma-70 family RNA polymerase sigma factor [Gemmatimonadales bacterium]|nr:sigma-70 family RNA polymerase sigma factor [Gemmatimonadales bacterium]
MDERELLAQRFEAHRGHLRAIAYRMLGSSEEAEDAVQEAWLRMSRAGADGVDNLGGWMTTIVGRICLDMLRARKAHREETLDGPGTAPIAGRIHERSPEEDAELADSVGLALLVVLETLEPAERVAFVLHDMFDLPFDDIAPIVGRTPVAARQLASRARRRVRGASTSGVDRSRQREVVEAFIAASKSGDFEALVAVLDPDIVARCDAQAIRMGGPAEAHGAATVAGFFKGRAQAAVAGFIDGDVGILVPVKGRMLLVLKVTIGGGKIAAIDAIADRDALAALELTTMDGGDPLAGSVPGRATPP